MSIIDEQHRVGRGAWGAISALEERPCVPKRNLGLPSAIAVVLRVERSTSVGRTPSWPETSGIKDFLHVNDECARSDLDPDHSPSPTQPDSAAENM